MRPERHGGDAGRRGVADGVEALDAALELFVGRLQLYLVDKGNHGPIGYRSPGTMTFMFNGAGIVDTLVMEFDGKPIHSWVIAARPTCVAAGDSITVEGLEGLEAMIYELIDRGAFLNADMG